MGQSEVDLANVNLVDVNNVSLAGQSNMDLVALGLMGLYNVDSGASWGLVTVCPCLACVTRVYII